MGQIMDSLDLLDFSDREFAREAKKIHQDMLYQGWKLSKQAYVNGILYIHYKKNGYATAIEFGCKEDVTGE